MGSIAIDALIAIEKGTLGELEALPFPVPVLSGVDGVVCIGDDGGAVDGMRMGLM